jgi:molecular chaperone DnaK (HSP70)
VVCDPRWRPSLEAGAEHPGAGDLTSDAHGPLVVGIDLGTTNSAVAWIDIPPGSPKRRGREGGPKLFQIQQLVASSEVRPATVLPSFIYFPSPDERETGAIALPWNPNPDAVAGIFARDHGALVPTRLVSSAKSWLANAAVDRRAALLPWAADGTPKISPVDASARLLAHLRDSWNHEHAQDDETKRLERQEIVLTVPASFDEEARELTVEAAREIGFERLTLLEEPLAAVYAWIASHSRELKRLFTHAPSKGSRDLSAAAKAERLLLVCDVGGGTTDFSLLRATVTDADIVFERIAIGEHLLLGGDNVDLALAAIVERKLADGGASARLGLVQRQSLRRLCSAGKEQLLRENGPDRVTITVLGTGRGVVGGAMTTELTRDEAIATLDDFLPIVSADERPQRHVRHGLRELGLPYETEPAVTRHLAGFLARAAVASQGLDTAAGLSRPDAVLFNGGFFTPAVARERMLNALAAWFGDRPAVLVNDSPEAAVAIGAAFYGGLRHATDRARRLLIQAGSARSYYIAVHEGEPVGSANANASGSRMTAVCVLPRGIQEGTRFALDRSFTVIANQPAAFTLLSATDRSDVVNEVISFSAHDQAHVHAPLVTALRYGQRSRRVPLKVRLTVVFTEVGTLELWCESLETDHRWRLQFNLRATQEPDAEAAETDGVADQVVVGDESVAAAEDMIRRAFSSGHDAGVIDALVGELEQVIGHGKHAWPLAVIRRLADALLAIVDGRRISARHEARWLNLTGLCIRPGFGTPVDPFRITELRKVYAAGLAHPQDIQCQVEWLILWQRVSAGFTTSQQQELANRMTGLLGLGTRKAPRLNPQMLREAWRLLAGLERLDRAQRVRLGDELIAKVRRESQNGSLLWAIGRLGARVPLYGPLNSVVPPADAERWLDVLRAFKAPTTEALAAAAQIAARTGDVAREVSEEERSATIAWLEAAGASEETLRLVREVVPVDPLLGSRAFGEALPQGLRLGS